MSTSSRSAAPARPAPQPTRAAPPPTTPAPVAAAPTAIGAPAASGQPSLVRLTLAHAKL